jgi:hypothetical protein
MIRTQIQLTEDQAERLKEQARRMDVSIAELVRRGVEKILEDAERGEKWRRASALVGCCRDTATDVAERHDDYLDDVYST